VLGDTEQAAIASLEVCDFAMLPDILWGSEKRVAMCVLTGFSYGEASFDKVKQTLYIPIYDSNERKLVLSARYTDCEPAKTLLDNLQYMLTDEKLCQSKLLIKLYLQNGEMAALPIALLGESIMNLSLDKLSEGKKTNKYFNW
jgi:hypothetical protein